MPENRIHYELTKYLKILIYLKYHELIVSSLNEISHLHVDNASAGLSITNFVLFATY